MIAGVLFVMIGAYLKIAEPEWVYTHRESMIDNIKSEGIEYKWTQEKIDIEIQKINNRYLFH
jgi:hypothetical protein